jgi:hypothetical protein
MLPMLVLAQGASLPSPDEFEKFAYALVRSVTNGQWNVSLALVVVGFVWALRKFGVKNVKFFQTDTGGVALLMITAAATVLTTSLLAGGPFTWAWGWGVFKGSVVAAVVAGGGWNLAQGLVRFVVPTILSTSFGQMALVSRVLKFLLTWVSSKAPQPQ